VAFRAKHTVFLSGSPMRPEITQQRIGDPVKGIGPCLQARF
jgi:hypothetical protein